LNVAHLDGVAIMAPETPQVRDAIARLKGEGLAVVTLVSDLPHSDRDYFIGINNVAAGRTAALLMGRFVRKSGDILVVVNSMQSRDNLDRRLGFDQIMASDFPDLTVLPSIESFDDPGRLQSMIGDVIPNRPKVRGIYSIGFGDGPLIEAVRKTGRLSDVTLITHELTPTTRAALVDNEIAAVITQNVGHLARGALRVLRAVCDKQPIFESQETVRIEIVLRENMP
jgi:LacI family transcriptional regulator